MKEKNVGSSNNNFTQEPNDLWIDWRRERRYTFGIYVQRATGKEPSNGKKNVITKKDRCILKTKKETDDPMINNRLQELSHSTEVPKR